MARELISKNATKSVYRDGDKAVKVFCKGFPKAEVLNEALISARVEAIGGINIPSIQAVSVEEDGCWSITRDYIEGKTLTELMKEKPDKRDEYLNQMVELQLMIHSKTCPLLNKLKDKMARQISEMEELDPVNRYDLLTRLDSTPKHIKLCHGDFQPDNIIVKEDGTMYVVDWVHATQGKPAQTWPERISVLPDRSGSGRKILGSVLRKDRYRQTLCTAVAASGSCGTAHKETSGRKGTASELAECM